MAKKLKTTTMELSPEEAKMITQLRTRSENDAAREKARELYNKMSTKKLIEEYTKTFNRDPIKDCFDDTSELLGILLDGKTDNQVYSLIFKSFSEKEIKKAFNDWGGDEFIIYELLEKNFR